MSESTTPGKKGNLTGSARKLKDDAADWHNLILKWERLNEEGSTTATKIVNLGRSKKSDVEPDVVMEGGSLAAGDFSQNLKQSNQELEEECVKLQDVVDKLANILSKMVHAERGICELEVFQFGEKGRAAPFFHTWSTQQFERESEQLIKTRFSIHLTRLMDWSRVDSDAIIIQTAPIHCRRSIVEVSSKLYESYKQELALKKTILQELAHTANADLSMVYLSSWLYQPYLEDSGKLLLESLLLETGHRPL